MSNRWWWAAAVLLCGAGPAAAAEHLIFRSLGVNAGLPNPNVNVALRTRDGYLWVGTESGLARFNGVRFTAFRTSNVAALKSNLIESLCEGADGTLWIGTQRGLVRERAGRFEAAGLDDISIPALACDRQGRLWIGTLWQGLYCYQHGVLSAFPPSPELPSPRIRCLLVDGADRLWIGCARGLGAAYLENGELHAYDGAGQMRSEIMGICEQPRGTLWFATQHRGVFRLRDNRLDVAPWRTRLLNIAADPAGGVWVASDGLWHLDAERLNFEAIAHPPSHNIQALTTDGEGSLWISASTDGLFQARSSAYELLPDNAEFQAGGVKTVAEDTAGNLWLATDRKGFLRLAPDGTMARFGAKDGIAGGDDPTGVLVGRDGTRWIGVSGGLWEWREGKPTKRQDFTNVHGLYEDRAGTIWVGSYQGVFRRDPGGAFARLRLSGDHPGELPIATAFTEGRDGAVYIGTWRDGIYRVRGERIDRLDHAGGLPSDEVRSLYVDRDGLLWAGMRTHGVAVYADGRWFGRESLAEKIGDHVSALTEDDGGNLWLGTTMGIMWAAKADLLAACRGLRPPPKLRVIGLSDGPDSPSVWLGSQPTVCRTAGGKLIFATHRGALVLDPRHPGGNDVPPPVEVTRMVVDDRPLDLLGPAVVVPAGASRIAFEFEALSLVQSDRLQFEYKLEGYESDWSPLGGQRSILFTRLPPRSYVFRVRAANSDGIWNESGAALPFRVAPSFWQQTWFRLAVVGLFTIAIASAVRYVSFRRLRVRVRALEQEAALNRERSRIAQDIHDDLGGSLTQLKLLLELVQRDKAAPEKVGGHVRQGLSAARTAMKSLDETVWAVNPRNDTLPHLIDYIGQFAMEFLKAARIECLLDLPNHPPDWPVPADLRHHLFLCVKEALNNIVRHGGAGEVKLRLNVTPEGIDIFIDDNGRGFVTVPADDQADGLRNMRQRMEEAGGSFAIDSAPNVGTRVTLRLPLL